jgi:DNA repair exonuclease SbcCD nuclease subunit
MARILCFTDVHLGKRGNSRTHNQDVIDFLKWAIEVGREKNCTHACFLGDWHDDRTKLDARTLNFSQKALELINGTDYIEKCWFLVGNHDLFYRHHRGTHSVPHANPLKKIITVKEPLDDGELLFLPYLFPSEYEILVNTKAKFVFGHLELKGFVITGSSNYKMPHGPDANQFTGPRLILSGHFHKRQAQGNVCYIGNAFPMDFGDAGDTARGVAIVDTEAVDDQDLMEFVDWPDCPRYTRCTLSEVLGNPEDLLAPKARIRCSMDIPVSYEEASYIKEKFMGEYKLREFQLEDPNQEEQMLALGDDALAMKEIAIGNMDEVVLEMLAEVSAPGIDNELLQRQYREL